MGRILARCGWISLAVLLVAALVWKGYDVIAPIGAATLAPVSAPVTSPNAPSPEATPSLPSATANTVLVDVPYLNQNAYPTGCESVSAVMVMRYWGVDITVSEFIDNYLHCRKMYMKNGVLMGPSPDDAFIGDPRTTYGYGCNISPIGLACHKRLGDDFLVLNRSDWELTALTEQYIDHDIPVLIWATINMVEPYPSDTWTNERDGSTVQWIANEHCLVLVGYDDKAYYCNDPYNNNGVVAYSRELLEQRYAQMGKQALVIRPATE